MLLLLFTCLLVASSVSTYLGDPSSAVFQELYTKLRSTYSKETHSFRKFPPRFASLAGLYESAIHINNNISVLRHDFAIPDMNMFVTNFVLTGLLELYNDGILDAGALDMNRFVTSLKAILSFQDQMFPEGTPIYRFWPGTWNGSIWEARPTNLLEPLSLFPDVISFVEFVLKMLGLKHAESEVAFVAKVIGFIIDAFHIPSDIDDASCNLALGSLLEKSFAKDPKVFGEARDVWKAGNLDSSYAVLFQKMIEVAWDPFADNSTSVSLIDPRTYMFAIEYVAMRAAEGARSIRLPVTWLMSQRENHERYPSENIPYNVNNLDSNVLTNFLYGMSLFLVHHPSARQIVPQEIVDMMLETARYLSWGVDSGRLFERTDLALTYYPSIYDFAWFVGRTLFVLETEDISAFPELSKVKETLENVARGNLTMRLLGLMKTEGKFSYWDDFLGDLEKKPLGEDRLFSTGLAVNALIDAWTIRQNTSRIWLQNVPAKVKNVAVPGGILQIETNAPKKDALLYCPFFSGSTRGPGTSPFYYPANYYEYLNGTKITTWPPEDMNLLSDSLNIAIQGYVRPEEYEPWTHRKFFGKYPPLYDTGFDFFFPFWSSDAMTLVVDMLALGKFSKIKG